MVSRIVHIGAKRERAMDRLVVIDPKEVSLQLDEAEQGSSSSSKASVTVHLRNVLHTMPVAFKVQATVLNKYVVKPPFGIIPPLGVASPEIVLLLRPEHKHFSIDKFVVSSVVVAGVGNKRAPSGSQPKEWFAPKKKVVYTDDSLRVAVVGGSILRDAVARGAMEEAREVLERQVDVNATDAQGRTAMHWAVANQRAEMVPLLLEFGASLEVRSYPTGQTPVHEACASPGGALILELLLAKGASAEWVDASGWRALHRAVSNGHPDVLRVLLDRGADVNAAIDDGRTALHMAVIAGDVDSVEMLLQHGADVDVATVDGKTALHFAATQGNKVSIAKLLLAWGAQRDVTDSQGRTAYDEAVELGQESLFDVLEVGDGLRNAAWKGDWKGVRRLLKRGACVNAQDKFGWTALHCAAFKGRLEVAKQLLDRAADAAAVDQQGYTPLHCAAESGHAQVVQLLLSRGHADPNALSAQGLSALDIASSLHHTTIVRLLRAAGARFNKDNTALVVYTPT